MEKALAVTVNEYQAPTVLATPSALEAMERANIDVQIATAQKYKRNLTTFYAQAKQMVGMDRKTAQSCIYRRPVGRDEGGQQKMVSGPSIRLAEIVASAYHNIRVASIVTEFAERHVKAVGYCHDLENNVATQIEVVTSTVQRNGQPYSERQRVVMAAAASSKARRGAIFGVVPISLCTPIIEYAMEVTVGDKRTMEEHREGLQQWIKGLGIDSKRVFAAIGVKGLADVGAEAFIELVGIKTAIEDGDTTAEEAFPPVPSKRSTEAVPLGEAAAEDLEAKKVAALAKLKEAEEAKPKRGRPRKNEAPGPPIEATVQDAPEDAPGSHTNLFPGGERNGSSQ